VRVEFPACVVPKVGADEVSGDAIFILAGFANARFRQLLKLGHCQSDGPVVQFDNAGVLVQGDNGDALWRADRKIVEHAPVQSLMAVLAADGLHSLRQPAVGFRMLAVAEGKEGLFANLSGERQLGRALAEPFAEDRSTLRVIVAAGKVFPEVGLGHGQVELYLRTNHLSFAGSPFTAGPVPMLERRMKSATESYTTSRTPRRALR